MDFADLQETYGGFYTPRFDVEVGGQTFGESDGLISGLQVDAALDRTNRFSFTLNDVFDLANERFTEQSEQFEAGTTVDVRMGYGDERKHVLRGKIDSVRPTFPADGGPTKSVSGHDLLHGLTTGTGTGSWSDESLDTVVSDLTSGTGFRGTNVEGSDVTFEQLAHPETSDYRFLDSLAGEHGFELFSRAGVLQFREPRTDDSPKLTLAYGRALRSFTPGDGGESTNIGTVKVRHWDETNKTEIVGTAEVEGGGSETKVVRVPVRSTEEAERRAKAEADRLARTGQSRGETIGIPDLQVGDVVELTGLGETYSTNYYVEGVGHRIGQSGYTTSFEVREIQQ